MTSSYWMNVNDPGFPFMVFVEHTNYMPPEDYGGCDLSTGQLPCDGRSALQDEKDEVLPRSCRI